MNSGHLGVEYKMRLSEDLRNRIKESAKQLNRSMNQDIVARLEQTFEQTQEATMQEIKTNYYVQKVYGLIYVVQNLESTVQNFKYLISTAETEKDKEKFRILLEFSQNNLANAQERIQTILDGLSLSMFDESNQQFLQSLVKKPTK